VGRGEGEAVGDGVWDGEGVGVGVEVSVGTGVVVGVAVGLGVNVDVDVGSGGRSVDVASLVSCAGTVGVEPTVREGVGEALVQAIKLNSARIITRGR
jgi:hypothetical protein